MAAGDLICLNDRVTPLCEGLGHRECASDEPEPGTRGVAASVAVFGASKRARSAGQVVLDNIVNGGFAGAIWPVNPRYSEVTGRPCYGSAVDLPCIPTWASS